MTEHSPFRGLVRRELLAAGTRKRKKKETENYPGQCRNFTCREQKADGSDFCENHGPKDNSGTDIGDPLFIVVGGPLGGSQ